MKNKLFFILSLALLTATFFTGCKKGCTNPLALNYEEDAKKDDGSCEFATEGTLSLMLHHKVGNDDFAFNQTYQDGNGRDFIFTEARLYFSNFGVESGSTVETIDDSYVYVSTDQQMYTVGTVAGGSYDGIELSVGVAGDANHNDPSTYPIDHPLANQSPNMNWGWASGYIFIMLEGKMDTTAAMNGNVTDGNFVMHVGTDGLLQDTHLHHEFSVDESGYMIHANLDWRQFLAGIDLRTENSTHTMDNMALASKVAANAAGVLSIHN